MRKATLALAGMAMMAAGGMAPIPTTSAPVARATTPQVQDQPATPRSVATSPEQRAILQAWKALRSTRRTYPTQGWSVMHDRRMARKKRNRTANRAAHRG